MKRKFYLIFLLATTISFSSVGQTSSTIPIAPLMEIPAATKFRNLLNKSDKTLIPDSITTILKEYAFRNQHSLNNVLKNKFVLSVLYNPEISVQEKIESLDYLMDLYNYPSAMIPMLLLKNLKQHFLSIYQTKNHD